MLVIEAMKMEHELGPESALALESLLVSVGEQVGAGQVVATLVELDEPADPGDPQDRLGHPRGGPRADLAEVLARHEATTDAARPEAAARRHALGKRTARENLADLLDPGSFVEYGALALAAQRDRRSLEELIAQTPADGLVGGVGRVEGHPCVVASYDYTVLAGTQGFYGHQKKDRLFSLAERLRLPVVLFAEGGGGRPGDTSAPAVSGLEVMAFALFGRLSGLVPLVGVASGRCFAGNAALLGCCDLIIATEDANIGMAGPAMIEGGGLGRFAPEQIGPAPMHYASGVVDLLVADEAAATAAARRYLSYFWGPQEPGEAPDQALLREAVPEDRKKVYDVRQVISTLADIGTVMELRGGFGVGMVTALVRIEGRPVGVVANQPGHLGGAIDAEGADKAARFLQLCDAFDLPVVFLCDTPGFMVGPEAEKTAQVRRFARLFVVGASLSVPYLTVVLRKGYGLGAQAMAGGSFRAPALTVAWPTGEIGGMGLEGAVRLGFKKELEAKPEGPERQELFERLLGAAYRNGRALSAAANFEVDDVIDPADTRRLISEVLCAAPAPPPRAGKKRPCIDPW